MLPLGIFCSAAASGWPSFIELADLGSLVTTVFLLRRVLSVWIPCSLLLLELPYFQPSPEGVYLFKVIMVIMIAEITTTEENMVLFFLLGPSKKCWNSQIYGIQIFA